MPGASFATEELPGALLGLLPSYVARQRWYSGEGPPRSLAVRRSACLGGPESSPGRLLWAIVAADGSDYQLLVAERPEGEGRERVKGHEEALIGTGGGHFYYDAAVDPEMAAVYLRAASGGSERATRARLIGGEQSNTSIVFDERLVLKIFRRLRAGPNPDAEVTSALAERGFRHVARPLLRWQEEGRDLAFGEEYLAGGTDGWALALTSLRDYYATASTEDSTHPGLSGGDFAAEAARLGQVTAEMHLALAGAYPAASDLRSEWPEMVRSLEREVRELVGELSSEATSLFARLRQVADPGPALRVHGDFHLGQVMRTDSGWYVLDFEGEPNRPLEERSRPTSVMRDVAGMLRSLDYAARFALGERAEGPASYLEPLRDAWLERNSAAFLRGYYETKGIDELLPPRVEEREAVRAAFELEKALYELRYELDFRPQWVRLPRAALAKLLTTPVEELLAAPAAEGEEAGEGYGEPGMVEGRRGGAEGHG
jgi:maltokinase